MKLLEADTKPLEYLLNLSYGKLRIPYSQRPYEWQNAQVLRLFNDFYSVYTNIDSNFNHILNFITIRIDEEDDTTKYIHDGQQRTVTSLLLLSALISELNNMDDAKAKASADSLTNLYLYNEHWKDNSITNLKIVFDNEDANFMLHEYVFKERQNLDENFKFSDYDIAIYERYNELKNLIHERFGDTPRKEDILDFIDAILNRVLVVLIQTPFDNIAEDMFETLNSTGLHLADFYILKNTLVGTLDEERVKPIWSSIEINTDRINKSKFLHAYVNTINGKTPSNSLYKKISSLRNLENPQIAMNFLTELKKTSEIFMKINNPSQRTDGTQEQNATYLQCINNLALIKATQYKPVILAMGLKDFNISDINLVLKKIIALQLRNVFIANYTGNTLEQFYPSLANSIYLGEITDVRGIISVISTEIISDSQLYDHFNSKLIESPTDEAIIRFIIKEIYNSENVEVVINASSRDVNLEHILPKTPLADSQWLTHFPNEDERYALTRKIGNLTVLLNRLNSRIRNGDFSIKKNTYLESVIQQNKDLGLLTEWRKTNIEQRTITLYNLFKQVWPK